MNGIFSTGSLRVELKRRYATRFPRFLIRGLKPTATIVWSLRDRSWPSRASRSEALRIAVSFSPRFGHGKARRRVATLERV